MSTLHEMLFTIEALAAVLLGSGAVLFAMLYRGARLVPEAWYATEQMLGIVFAPLCVTVLAAGLGVTVQMVQAWSRGAMHGTHLAVAGALAAAFALAVHLLRRATPRPARDAGRAGANVVSLPVPGPSSPPPRPQPVKHVA